MEWLRKCHRRDLQEKVHLQKYRGFIMGYVLYLQVSIGRGGIYEGGEDQVGTILEGICLANHISKQVSKVALQ